MRETSFIIGPIWFIIYNISSAGERVKIIVVQLEDSALQLQLKILHSPWPT